MKTGRNKPCPCGSGKKYKRCCLSKTELNSGGIESLPNLPEDPADLGDDERLLLLSALNNMRKRTLERKPHIKKYKQIRKLHSEICDSMSGYYDDGKFEHKYVIPPEHEKKGKNSPRTLRLISSSFDFDSKVGVNAFYDMIIYKNAPNANSITEEFIRNKRYRKPEKIDFLQAMLDSRLGLFEVTDVDYNEGYASIKEVFIGDTYRIIDIGLSGNHNFDDTYIYTRIITYHGMSFGTGLNLIFYKTDPFIQKFIRRQKKEYSPTGEFVRFSELYNRFSQNPNGIFIQPNTF